MNGATPLEKQRGRPLVLPSKYTARGVFELRDGDHILGYGRYDTIPVQDLQRDVMDYESGEDFTGRQFPTYRDAALAKKHGPLPVVVEVLPSGTVKYALREGDLKILAHNAVGKDSRYPKTEQGLRNVVADYMSDEDGRWDDERRARAVDLLRAYLRMTRPRATKPNHHGRPEEHEEKDPLGVYFPPLSQWERSVTTEGSHAGVHYRWIHPRLGWTFHIYPDAGPTGTTGYVSTYNTPRAASDFGKELPFVVRHGEDLTKEFPNFPVSRTRMVRDQNDRNYQRWFGFGDGYTFAMRFHQSGEPYQKETPEQHWKAMRDWYAHVEHSPVPRLLAAPPPSPNGNGNFLPPWKESASHHGVFEYRDPYLDWKFVIYSPNSENYIKGAYDDGYKRWREDPEYIGYVDMPRVRAVGRHVVEPNKRSVLGNTEDGRKYTEKGESRVVFRRSYDSDLRAGFNREAFRRVVNAMQQWYLSLRPENLALFPPDKKWPSTPGWSPPPDVPLWSPGTQTSQKSRRGARSRR